MFSGIKYIGIHGKSGRGAISRWSKIPRSWIADGRKGFYIYIYIRSCPFYLSYFASNFFTFFGMLYMFYSQNYQYILSHYQFVVFYPLINKFVI